MNFFKKLVKCLDNSIETKIKIAKKSVSDGVSDFEARKNLKNLLHEQLDKEIKMFKLSNKPKYKVGDVVYLNQDAHDGWEGNIFQSLKSFRTFNHLEDFKCKIESVNTDFGRIDDQIYLKLQDLEYNKDGTWDLYDSGSIKLTTEEVVYYIFNELYSDYQTIMYSYNVSFENGLNPIWDIREDKFLFLDIPENQDKHEIQLIKLQLQLDETYSLIQDIKNGIKDLKIKI